MTSARFLELLQKETEGFANKVSTNEGEWIVKGFIDIYRQVYAVSLDTKLVSKVFELLLFPIFNEFAQRQDMQLELCPQQNFYPDLSFVDKSDGSKFAVDVK